MNELGKIDPKCWVCGIFVKPIIVRYQPLRCSICENKKKRFVFNRPTQEEMIELVRVTDAKIGKKGAS